MEQIKKKINEEIDWVRNSINDIDLQIKGAFDSIIGGQDKTKLGYITIDTLCYRLQELKAKRKELQGQLKGLHHALRNFEQ